MTNHSAIIYTPPPHPPPPAKKGIFISHFYNCVQIMASNIFPKSEATIKQNLSLRVPEPHGTLN